MAFLSRAPLGPLLVLLPSGRASASRAMASGPRRAVGFFYDVLSPYSWLGFEILCRYRDIWNIELCLRPASIAGIMKESGSLSAMCFITAVDLAQPQLVEAVSRELWMRVWSRDEDITQPESILAAAGKAGLSSDQGQKLLEMCNSPDVKNRLKATTDEVVQLGAFGLPCSVIYVDDKPQLVFGSDRLELLGSLLGEKWLGPVPRLLNSRLRELGRRQDGKATRSIRISAVE